MKTTQLKWAAMLLGVICTHSAWAAEPTLKVGDPAPKLQTGKWIQGDPVKGFEKGKTYIVEFWATWCGPCRTSIPHLNEIHAKFKDKGLIVIGQDSWEQDESKVEPFVKSMGDKMTYRVALDDKQGSEKGKMAETWMDAAGQNGIPTAFIIDSNQKLAWVGHPMTLKDELIDSVLSGKHDLKKALADFMAERKRAEEWQAAQVPKGKVYAALRKKDWTDADAKLAEAEKTLSKEDADDLRVAILMAKRDYPGVEALLKKLYAPSGAQPPAESAGRLNAIAWQMAVDPEISADDLARAETIAHWADNASENKEPMILDTVARVLFRRNKQQEAIALQQKAAKLSDEGSRSQYEQTLESYRKGVLPKAQ